MVRHFVWTAFVAIIIGCGGGSGKSDQPIAQPDAGTPDDGTPDAGTPDTETPDAGSICTPGDACEAPNSCHAAGQYVCNADGTKTCTNADNLPDGTSCGTGNSCSAGECVSPPPPVCTPGGTCHPSNPCHTGKNACDSHGAIVCSNTGNLPDGTSCGTGLTCKAGACVSPTHQCTPGGACQPSNPCHVGSYTCVNDARVCSDANTNVPDGTVCGTSLSCQAGACIPPVVPLPTITSFTATPNQLVGSGSSLLEWKVSGATKVALNNGIGTVTGNAVSVTISATTTWTLTATNSAGKSVTKQVTVVVKPPESPIDTIVVTSNTQEMIADRISHPTLIIMCNKSGVVVACPASSLYANGTLVTTGNFTTNTAGSYTLVVKIGSVTSNSVTVLARSNKTYQTRVYPAVMTIGYRQGEALGVGANISTRDAAALFDRVNVALANNTGSTDPNAVDTHIRIEPARTLPDGTVLTEPGVRRIEINAWDVMTTAVDVPGDGLLGPNEVDAFESGTFVDQRSIFNFSILPTAPNNQSVTSMPLVYVGFDLAGLQTATGGVTPPNSGNFYGMSINTDYRLDYIVHEFGHYLGLLHVFSVDGCVTSDFTSDTYSYNWYTGVSCSDNLGVLVRDNYLDYWIAYNTFTYDQRDRMWWVLQHGVWISELPYRVLGPGQDVPLFANT